MGLYEVLEVAANLFIQLALDSVSPEEGTASAPPIVEHIVLLCPVEDECHGDAQLVPSGDLGLQTRATALCQLVVLGPPVVV
jgi:hypothetical protein